MREPLAFKARSATRRRLLVVQKNLFAARSLARYVADLFDEIAIVDSAEAAESIMSDPSRTPTDLVCGQDFGPNAVTGGELIQRWRAMYAGLERVVLATGASELPPSFAGIDLVFLKPGNPRAIALALTRASA